MEGAVYDSRTKEGRSDMGCEAKRGGGYQIEMETY